MCDLCKKTLTTKEFNTKRGKLYPVKLSTGELGGICFDCLNSIIQTYVPKQQKQPKQKQQIIQNDPIKNKTTKQEFNQTNPIAKAVSELKNMEDIDYDEDDVAPKPKRLEDESFFELE